MKKIKIKKIIAPSIVVLAVLLLIGWLVLDKRMNEPTRVIEAMLSASTSFDQKPSVAKKFFEPDYLQKVKINQPIGKVPAHSLKVSSSNGQNIVTLSFSRSKDEAVGSTEVIRFYLVKHGYSPWLYWTKIANVELLDISYASTFANILPETKKIETKFNESFALSGRFEVSLENFKDLTGDAIGSKIKKYSFDILYKNKPVDFHALSLAVSLLGENDTICVKSQRVEVSDLAKDSQTVKLTVFDDLCIPKSIQIDGSNIDSINVSIK